MATHPVEPDAESTGDEPVMPNPTRLPVQPEFGPLDAGVDPEDPGVKAPEL